MLRFWFLNVGQGDSTVVEYKDGTTSHYGVIDSNLTGTEVPPALTKLRSLGAKRLSFVALTHPHADHYQGLSQIIDAYAGQIGQFFTYPLSSDLLTSGRLKKIAHLYQRAVRDSDSRVAHRRANEFVRILVNAKEKIGIENWEQVVGPRNRVYPDGFKGVELEALLPLARVKGDYFRMIQQGDHRAATESSSLNDLSIGFQFRYAGREIVIGGDAPVRSWRDHARQLERGGDSLQASLVRLPHHGSKYDNTKLVLDHVFDNSGSRVAVISADGQGHPHNETYGRLAERVVSPYCTNLARQCGATIRSMIRIPEAARVLERWLNSYGEDEAGAVQPCQGDVLVEVGSEGDIEVTPELDNVCPYRGVLGDLFSGASDK